jgi:hypothetical protein
MQIRIGLIPLITSTFVLYAWELPDNATQNYLTMLPSEYLRSINKNYVFWKYASKTIVSCVLYLWDTLYYLQW